MPYRIAYNMLRAPFSAEIEAHALLTHDAFNQGLARLDYLRRERGLAALVGEVGSGKTTLIRSFLSRLALSSHRPLYAAVPDNIKNPLKPIIEQWVETLGERVPHFNPGRSLQILKACLADIYEKGCMPFLVVDEAHLLDERSLLLLKSVLNHDMDSRLPLALLLAGGPSLARRLAQKNMEELRQRLLFLFPMGGLRRDEMEAYITSRLRSAGCDRNLFPADVLDDIYRQTKGVARLVNQLATLSLVAAANDKKPQVDAACLRQAILESGLGDTASRTA